MPDAVIRAAGTFLAHAPGLALHGSKPSRTLAGDNDAAGAFIAGLRSYDEALAYAPHQAYLGTCHPRDLPERPWAYQALPGAQRFAPFGEFLPEQDLLAVMALVDEFGLLTVAEDFAEKATAELASHPLAAHLDLPAIKVAAGDVAAALEKGAIPLHVASHNLVAALSPAHAEDESLSAPVLLENLACKATGTLALMHLLHDNGLDPAAVQYTISCSEEAIGDRYQRGGGNMGKTIAAAAGLADSSGADVKNFCAAPIPALVIAASLVTAGVFEQVAVVAGGSLPKLGMKYQGHLRHELPVLEDVIAGAALLVTEDDGVSPRIRLDAVGRHRVSSGGANAQILHDLAVRPLEELGLAMTDVDDYATELHNPEITEPQGSGDVAKRNYKTLAALAARRGAIAKDEIDDFVARRGMPGYAPTQGHIASALCYLPHALTRLRSGAAQRALLMAKGSLFLGRMSQRSDGMSVLIEANPG